MRVHTLVVTSAVIPIPQAWRQISLGPGDEIRFCARDSLPRTLAIIGLLSRSLLCRRVWISLGLRTERHDFLTITAREVCPEPRQSIALVEGA